MLRKVLYGLAGVAWFAFVFSASVWLTFPSNAIISRLAYQVDKASNGALGLQIDGLSPRPLLGVAGSGVRLLSVDDEGQGSPVLLASSVTASVSPMSLISFAPAFHGNVVIKGGSLAYGGTYSDGKLTDVSLDGKGLPIGTASSILAPFVGELFRGEGKVDLELQMSAPEGLHKARGEISLKGRDLQVWVTYQDPISGDPDELGPIHVSELDVQLDVRDGKAKVKSGRLLSDYLNIDLSGEIQLTEDPSRSSLRLKAVLSDLENELSALSRTRQLKAAQWDDGTFHFEIRCALNRLNGRCFRPERNRRAPASSASTRNPRTAVQGDDKEPDPDADARELRRRNRDRLLREQRGEGNDGPLRPPGVRGPVDRVRPNRPDQFDGQDAVDDEDLPPDDDTEFDDEDLPLPDDLPEPGALDLPHLEPPLPEEF